MPKRVHDYLKSNFSNKKSKFIVLEENYHSKVFSKEELNALTSNFERESENKVSKNTYYLHGSLAGGDIDVVHQHRKIASFSNGRKKSFK